MSWLVASGLMTLFIMSSGVVNAAVYPRLKKKPKPAPPAIHEASHVWSDIPKSDPSRSWIKGVVTGPDEFLTTRHSNPSAGLTVYVRSGGEKIEREIRRATQVVLPQISEANLKGDLVLCKVDPWPASVPVVTLATKVPASAKFVFVTKTGMQATRYACPMASRIPNGLQLHPDVRSPLWVFYTNPTKSTPSAPGDSGRPFYHNGKLTGLLSRGLAPGTIFDGQALSLANPAVQAAITKARNQK